MSQEASRKDDRTNAYAVLSLINRKETEIRHQVAEAQHRAAALVQAAREEAELRLAQADQEARAEAERLYQCGLEEANEKAEILLSTAQEQAAALRRLAQARLDKAAWNLVNLILPQESSIAQNSSFPKVSPNVRD
jgi:vacuolar-type H+-ATPase subunit H